MRRPPTPLHALRRNANRVRRLASRSWHRVVHSNPHPDWSKLLKTQAASWAAAATSARRGQKVLIATTAGGYVPGAALESMLGAALTLRGAEVHFLLCDELLPGCMQALVHDQSPTEFARTGPAKAFCPDCFWPAERRLRGLGLPVHRLSHTLSADEQASAAVLADSFAVGDIASFTLDGFAIGEHAIAGALRYYARGTLPDTPEAVVIARRYLQAALLVTYATRRLLQTVPFDVVVFHHGIYVPQGLVGEVARKLDRRVVTWNIAYRKNCFTFSHGDTYHHTLLDEPVSEWESVDWRDDLERLTLDYLNSRRQGTRDWVLYSENPQEDADAIARELGVDFSKPCVGMLTNVVWDAQLHYRANAFPSMIDWTLETIRYFATRPDLQLILRVHPAELRGTVQSRQPIVAEIHKAFPRKPPNLFIIAPERAISTYAVMERCNAVLIYGTKMGVELAPLGIPVVVAGEAWIRNKGLTIDARSPQEYFAILDRLPALPSLTPPQIERARKYAFHYFFRRSIPVPHLTPHPGEYPPYELRLNQVSDLRPGVSVGVDVICDGILRGHPFVYPAEQVEATSPATIERVVSTPAMRRR